MISSTTSNSMSVNPDSVSLTYHPITQSPSRQITHS